MKHLLCGIVPGSPAEQAGLMAGDELTHIDGHEIRDIIDYQFYIAEGNPLLRFIRSGAVLARRVRKQAGEPLGIQFDNMLMDQTKTCANQCVFCFIDQMPAGQRDSLYVKDDDWRLSVLTGNYITLTNLPRNELRRIADRGVGPLYISVHATDGEVRARMMGNKNAAKIMDQLRFLNDRGIDFHAQIVVCPGVNDGEVLTKTIEDLLAFDRCLSAALVPVGLTMHRIDLAPVNLFQREEARNVLRILSCYKEDGRTYAADEFYLKAQLPLPPYEDYGDFPQIENGVGLLRLFEADYLYGLGSIENPEKGNVVILTGFSAAGFLREMIQAHPVSGVRVEVVPVENRFFGKSITVTGLLTGSDIIRAGKGIFADRILISACMLKADEDAFLDDLTLAEVRAQLSSPLCVSANDGESFAYALAGLKYEREQ